MLGTTLDIGDIVINKTGQVPILSGSYSLMKNQLSTKAGRNLISQDVVNASILSHLFVLLSIFI